MTKSVVAGAIIGAVWGILAVAVFGAMFRGSLPAPGDLALPLAAGLVLLYAPFLAAIGLETLIGRASPTFGELAIVALVAGMTTGVIAVNVVRFGRRVRGRRRAEAPERSG